MVPLGWALRAAGHEVFVASHPGFAPVITSAGLPALPVGPDFDWQAEVDTETERGRWFDEGSLTAQQIRRRRRDMVGLLAPRRSAEVMADDLLAFARDWRPDLVIYEPTAFAGLLAARVLDIPAVRHLWTADFTVGLAGNPLEHMLLGSLFERYGASHIGVLGDLTLDPCPPSLQVHDGLPREAVRYIPYNGPSVAPRWLGVPPGRPRICVTWGTSLSAMGGAARMAHVPRIVAALAGLEADIHVAVTDGQRDLFTAPRPANVATIGPVPLHLLLPSCAVIIHQGGGGNLMTAMASGTPQLIVPTLQDQAFNAARLAATGAGISLPGSESVAAADVTAAATALLTQPRYADRATALRAESEARPTPAAIVSLLEEAATALRPLTQAR
jgi:UDP:flavonoid glycosyltransferase YjiC (YdhE family)